MNSTINRLDYYQSNELNPIKTSPLLPPLKPLLMSKTRFQALSGSCAWKMRQLGGQSAVLMIIFMWASGVESKCRTGCDLALASYYVWEGANLTFVSKLFSTSIDNILRFSPKVTNSDYIEIGTRINIPFTCDCIGRQFFGHSFSYQVKMGDNYRRIAERYYANLSTVEWLQRSNSYDVNNIPNVDAEVNVVVNCSCGDRRVSSDYRLFVTYPLRPGENLSGIANEFGVASEWLQRYNVGSDFGSGSGLVFIPGKDQTGNFPPLKISPVAGLARGVIVGISVGGSAVALCLVFSLYVRFYERKKLVEASLLPQATQAPGTVKKPTKKSAAVDCNSPELNDIAVNKSVEFSYEELAKATNDFSMANKIGQGGFGAVYYAELRGEKAAIKKMDMEASQEFHAELKVLTHVHHLNLVRLIGYCVEGSLFLVYEFIENGNLSQHLHGSGGDALPWSTRMKIAIDSARGLEYIHEHTVPVYIHRDVKSSNILIDRNFRAKVADFGLTKLTKLGKTLFHPQVEGTFGYMPPEYITCGKVSSKLDVYAFGVVLNELISGKEAIVRINESVTEYKGLHSLFEDAFSQPDPNEALRKLVDPRLGDNYLLDSVMKIAQLARACTQDDPELRPSMGTILVALMTLSSSTGGWDVKLFNKNQAPVNLVSGKVTH